MSGTEEIKVLPDLAETFTLHLTGLPKNAVLKDIQDHVDSHGLKCENISIIKDTSAKLRFATEEEGKSRLNF